MYTLCTTEYFFNNDILCTVFENLEATVKQMLLLNLYKHFIQYSKTVQVFKYEQRSEQICINMSKT